MNTVGKILVICNLIFALLVAGFLVFDFATRTNWKAGFDEQKRENEVLRRHNNAFGSTTGIVAGDVKKFRNDLESERAKHVETKSLLEAQLAAADQSKVEAEGRARAAELNLQKSIDDNKRLHEEVKLLIANMKASEARVASLERDLQKSVTLLTQVKNEAASSQARANTLLESNRELQRKMAELANTTTQGSTVAAVRSPLGANPPPVRVQGQVLKVDAQDRTLVTISLGSDNGVLKNHTLEVYRFNPQPEYLGMVRVLDSYHKQSVGKLITPVGQRQMKAGDTVADSIIP